MNDKLMKTVIGAIVAVGLAIAVSYGLISQQTADKVQTQTNEALQGNQSGSAPAPQQSAPQQPTPAPQSPTTQAPTPNEPAPQNPAPAPRP